MTQNDIQRVTELSGFKVGKLPFTYLGVPISTSKLKAKDCQSLVEKMVIRIRVWGTRHLSFAARCQLVNSVLMSIHTYWGQLFIIPKSILKEVNSICRCFLWSGTHNDTRPGAVAWDKLCRNKKEGGLGFRETGIWNMIALCKLAWGVAQKQDNLWVKWVHGIYIKDANWENYTAPVHASWSWKYVCQAKNMMNEKNNGGQWLMNGQFSIKQHYQTLLSGSRPVNWARYVWNRYSIPKHRLIMWLAIQNRLKTRQRLKMMNVLQWLGVAWRTRNLDQFCRWSRNRYTGNRTRKMVLLSAIAATVCTIWRNRNSAYWEQVIMTVSKAVQEIKMNVKFRITQILSDKVKERDRRWIHSL
ncbi:uncharacterized protein LOC125498912 [Beta vulgaris subsp. vulgaris]|uniref:uncharacterized protein LOC125498912 n=1 Tax=Beta vulgaris subsp. vulgaris TaxID=3555 RepID=UPI0025489438|nr:uncharacterized protein LOC125498912 [Beta vulgaris subsp. vulgaris]